jgi:IclR family mhp operon transcriptional activator
MTRAGASDTHRPVLTAQQDSPDETMLRSSASYRPIRVLLRGLELIQALNEIGPARCETIARRLGLARTTIYRVARTLAHAGFVERDEATGEYRLTPEVARLSHGFDARAEVVAAVRPQLQARAAALQWPTTVMTFEWPDMVIQESTDLRSGFAVETFPIGARIPVMTSASGRLYLAQAEPAVRGVLLDYLWPRHQPQPYADWPNRAALEGELGRIRQVGHATAIRPMRVTQQGSIAVPIELDGQMVAALAVRFALSALPFQKAEGRFIPLLREIVASAQGNRREPIRGLPRT